MLGFVQYEHMVADGSCWREATVQEGGNLEANVTVSLCHWLVILEVHT